LLKGLDAQLEVLGRLLQKAGRETFFEDAPTENFAFEALAIIHCGREKLGFVELENVDLLLGAIELASKGEQFEKKQPQGLIARLRLDRLDLGVDGFLQLALLIELGSSHEENSWVRIWQQ